MRLKMFSLQRQVRQCVCFNQSEVGMTAFPLVVLMSSLMMRFYSRILPWCNTPE